MSDLVIETAGLRKEYVTRRMHRHVAVDALDLAVPASGVHGFLGPNGSGKTTTIRMLLGLARPTKGSMHILGEPVPAGLPKVMPRIGAVVESPKFLPGFTGRRNLSLLADVARLPHTRVGEVLERVGLQPRADDRYKGYSLGMRQRLAIAATLLKQPDLLILDEPTNGLDPQGIRDIRTMVRDLGSSGVTVLISSHLLAEVEQVCDSVTIVRRGQLVTTGLVSDLLARQGSGDIRVRVGDPTAAEALLTRSSAVRVRRDGAALLVSGVGDPAEVSRLLGQHGLWVQELTAVHGDLESAFLSLTGDEPAGLAPPASSGTGEDAGR
jgi:ABC-2 type transport system ATP-binding protein